MKQENEEGERERESKEFSPVWWQLTLSGSREGRKRC